MGEGELMKPASQELPLYFYVIAAVFFGAVALIAIVRHLLLKRRERSIRKSGDELGLAVYRNKKELLDQEGWDVADFTSRNGLFTGCCLEELTNIMYAENDGLSVFVFDQKYEELSHGGETRKRKKPNSIFGVRQTVVAIVSAEIDVQRFELSISGMAEQGFYEDFAKGMFEFFERYPKTAVEGNRQTILIYEPGKRFRPSEYSELVGRGFEVFQILKTKDDLPQEQMARIGR